MNASENIKAILMEQVLGYKTLLDTLQRERQYLMHINPNGVEALSKEKDTIVLKLKLLEEERIRLVRIFAANHAIAEETAFKKLSEVTGDDAFQRLRLQLISLIQSIMEFNDFNRILIERSSAVIKNALNFLGSAGINVNANKGSLISREA
jgi:flagellar biosynthesis/type III secretory pathway chaperone